MVGREGRIDTSIAFLVETSQLMVLCGYVLSTRGNPCPAAL